jgi:hypothetical protein
MATELHEMRAAKCVMFFIWHMNFNGMVVLAFMPFFPVSVFQNSLQAERATSQAFFYCVR